MLSMFVHSVVVAYFTLKSLKANKLYEMNRDDRNAKSNGLEIENIYQL